MYTVMRTGYGNPYQTGTNQTGKYRNIRKENNNNSSSSVSDTKALEASDEAEIIDTLNPQAEEAEKEAPAEQKSSPLTAEEQKEVDALQEFIKRMQEAVSSIKKACESSGKTNLYDATMDLMLIANAEKEPALRAIHAKLLFKSRAVRATSGADADEIRIALRKISKVIGKAKTKIKKLQKEELLEKKRKKAEAEKQRKMAEELQKELERKKKLRKNRERQDVEESKMGMGANYGGESSKFSPVQDVNVGAGISAGASEDILSQVEGVDMSPVSVGSEYASGGNAVAAEASLGTAVDVFL